MLYWHFNKIIKGPGTSFQSPALSQKNVRNVCRVAYDDVTDEYQELTYFTQKQKT